MYRRAVRLLLAASAALVLAASTAIGSALAAFPGANGAIAFVVADEPTGRSGTVVTVRADGASRRVVGRGSDPAWSPDGARLLFRTTRAGLPGLFTTTPIGRDLRRVGCATCADAGGIPRPVELFDAEWSPDGDLVAASWLDGIVVEDMTTGLDGEAGYDPRLTVHADCGAGCLSASSPAWSPDGTRIAFAHGDAGGDGGTVVGRICSAPSAGGARRCLTVGLGRPGSGLGGDSVPDWSPDGRWIAFQRHFACTGGACRSAIQVVRPDGTGLRRVVADGAMPTWSPDGTRLAFVRLARDDCGDPICRRGIWTVRLDGTGLQRVTGGRRDVFPDWQPR